jgi:hypothetical protein
MPGPKPSSTPDGRLPVPPARQPSPAAYGPSGDSGVTAGPNWGRNYRSGQAIPIDGTKKELRRADLGSPFTISVLPPDILLAALTGDGGFARTRDIYDPLLEQVFRDAQIKVEEVENIVLAEGGDPTTDPRVVAVRQSLLGGRAPVDNSQNIKILDAALQTNNGFSGARRREALFQASKFYAVGTTRETRAQILNRVDEEIGLNGRPFRPERVEKSAANQTAVSDTRQALDVLVQLNRMVATPPLTLLVNPQNMSVSRGKKQSYQDRNRFNYIFQSWGEEQVRLSVSGKSAGFVVGSPDGEVVNGQTSTPTGYQWASKADSAAWQNLMNLFTLYRNNAYIYNQLDKSEAHLWVGNIQIMYDQWVYLGQFESFTYSYNESQQHGAIEFSFEFVCSYVSDLSQAGVFPVRGWDSSTGLSVSSSQGSGVAAESAATRAYRELPQPDEAAEIPLFNPGTDPLGLSDIPGGGQALTEEELLGLPPAPSLPIGDSSFTNPIGLPNVGDFE